MGWVPWQCQWGWGGDTALPPDRAKYVNVTLALDTTRFLSQETEYMPWQAALTNLQYFQQMFDRSEVFGPMSVSGATPVLGVGGQGCPHSGVGAAASLSLGTDSLLPTEIHKESGDSSL